MVRLQIKKCINSYYYISTNCLNRLRPGKSEQLIQNTALCLSAYLGFSEPQFTGEPPSVYLSLCELILPRWAIL